MVYELLPTQPFGKKCNEYLLNRFLIMGLKKQNRPVLFFKTHILDPQNQYTPVLFFKHIYQVPRISTRLFYLKHIYQILRIRTRLFYFKTHILGPQNQNTPVLFFRAHILGTQNQNTPVLFFKRIYQILKISTRLFYFFIRHIQANLVHFFILNYTMVFYANQSTKFRQKKDRPLRKMTSGSPLC